MSEVYFSLDVETDGPIPFFYSMRQIGLVAFTLTDGVIGTFTRKLQPFPNAQVDPDTLRWWTETEEKRALWEALTVGAEFWHDAMTECDRWIRTFEDRGKPVCCASPAGYDWVFFRCYMVLALHAETPFQHRCWDARSHAMGILGKEYNSCGKPGIPQGWRPKDLPHTHDALDDALEQAAQFRNQMQASQAQKQAANAWIAAWPVLRMLFKHTELTAKYARENM